MRYIRLKKSKNIALGIIDDLTQCIEMKHFKLTYSLYTTPLANDPTAGTKAQNSAYQKINYFIEDVVDNSFLCAIDSGEVITAMMSTYNNNFIVMPSATEVALLEALHSKLNIFAGEESYVESIILEDFLTEQTYEYVQEDTETIMYDLPSTEQFLGEFALWSDPWWARYDISTTDNHITNQEDYDKFKELFEEHDIANVSRIVLDDIDSAIDEYFSEEREPGDVIDLEEMKESMQEKQQWKPTLV